MQCFLHIILLPRRRWARPHTQVAAATIGRSTGSAGPHHAIAHSKAIRDLVGCPCRHCQACRTCWCCLASEMCGAVLSRAWAATGGLRHCFQRCVRRQTLRGWRSCIKLGRACSIRSTAAGVELFAGRVADCWCCWPGGRALKCCTCRKVLGAACATSCSCWQWGHPLVIPDRGPTQDTADMLLNHPQDETWTRPGVLSGRGCCSGGPQIRGH
jgi:hypothetical protein